MPPEGSSRHVGGGAGNRYGTTSRPRTHVGDSVAGREVQDCEFLLRRPLLAAGGLPVGGGTPVPDGGGITAFLDALRRTYVYRLPVDDPVHNSSSRPAIS